MTRDKIFPFFVIFLFFLIQNIFCFKYGNIAPIFLLSAVLFYALCEGPAYGLWMGAFAGLLCEVFGSGRMGGEIFMFSLAGFLYGQTPRTFFRESIFSWFIFPAVIFYLTVLFRLILFHLGRSEDVGLFVLREAFYPRDFFGMCLAAPGIFYLLKKISYSGRRGI